MTTTSSHTSGDKVDFMTIVGFKWTVCISFETYLTFNQKITTTWWIIIQCSYIYDYINVQELGVYHWDVDNLVEMCDHIFYKPVSF